ncbi:PREDICTED: F-box/kelch-repeat protein At3g06240-like [Nicotiana attenuata]|uniref:F-boxkelch-repeat protein n=1 Tax=Nicotiana attenuata TaxID=49451 RepID=A0A314KHR6_NICAT|nr:PREDICTED: F-box/kelch-repeat protein At3g06240-like [Nicotiana attenuata]OIT28690.1 f-boxkelch-repeat protein [Nicotiana attenuata]
MGMSNAEKLPQEIIFDILTRLPAKLLGQFRCVSKQWCSLLSYPHFVKAHLNFHKHDQEVKLICIPTSLALHVNTFNHDPQNGIDAISRRLNFEGLSDNWERVVGSCNGLVLVLNEEDILFLINPTTLEYCRIPNSPLALPKSGTSSTYSLGYDSASDDYKVVTLSYYKDDISCTFVDVFSMRMGLWRRLESLCNGGAIPIHGFPVLVNGAFHWLAGKSFASAIVAFDLSDEKFFEVPVPTTTDGKCPWFYDLVGLGGCLRILAKKHKIDAWIMKEYGVAESWTKFSVTSQVSGFTPLRLMNDDDIVLDVAAEEKLIVYNKKEEQWRDLNVDGIIATFARTRTFMETLVSPTFGLDAIF